MGQFLFGEPRQKSAGSSQPSIPAQPKPVQPQHVHPQGFRPNPAPTGVGGQPWQPQRHASMPTMGTQYPVMHHTNYSTPNMVQGRPNFNAPPPPHFQGALGLDLGPRASHSGGMQAMPSGSRPNPSTQAGGSHSNTTGAAATYDADAMGKLIDSMYAKAGLTKIDMNSPEGKKLRQEGYSIDQLPPHMR